MSLPHTPPTIRRRPSCTGFFAARACGGWAACPARGGWARRRCCGRYWTCGRAELAAYLGDLQQTFRTDASNRDARFTRNRIRNELLPLLTAKYNATIIEALLRLGALAGESQELVDELVSEVVRRCMRGGKGEVLLDRIVLAAQPRHLVREVLIEVWRRQGWPLAAMGFSEWETLAAMISAAVARPAADVPKRMFPGAIVVEVRADELRLAVSTSASDNRRC